MPPDFIKTQKQKEDSEAAAFWYEMAQHLPKSIERAALGDEAICNAFRAAYPQMKATIIANVGRELEARCEKSKQDLDDTMEGGSHVNLLIKSHNEGIDHILTLIRSITGISPTR